MAQEKAGGVWIRFSLRIPRAVHADLVKAAGANSLNNEIIDRLRRSLGSLSPDEDQLLDDFLKRSRLIEKLDAIEERLDRLDEGRDNLSKEAGCRSQRSSSTKS